VNGQTQQVKKGQIASAVIEATPKSATVKTDKAAAMVEVNPQELMDENGWIVKDGKGFKVACGGTNAVEKGKLNTAAGEVEGHPVLVMRDSGCTTVLVKKSLVPKENFTGKVINVIMANSEVCSYPQAEINVKTPYFTGKTFAACLETPLFYLIIGEVPGATSGNLENCAVVTRSQHGSKKKVPKLKVMELTTLLQSKTIGEAQKDDDHLDGIRKHAEEGTVFSRNKKGETSQYIFKKSILYRRVKVKDSQEDQLIVPFLYRSAILDLAHSGMMGGHLGIGKTRDRIMDKFHWPGIAQEVARYCKSCDICQRTVDKGRVTKARLGKMPIIGEPFARVAVDLVGPMEPRSSNGSKYILTVVDYATRYPEAIALSNIDTVTVADALLEIFSRIGIPKKILSDRGAQFTSDMMKEVYRLLSIRIITTTLYHAMCNGLVERFNGTLKKMLRRMCSEQPREWHRYLAPLLFAYREVLQKSTKFSPFELVYGHTVRGPLALLKELWEGNVDEPETRTAYEYVLNLRERLEETCKMASSELQNAQEVAQRYYDLRTRERKLKVGDDVLLLLPTNNNKLLLQWKGPFKVVKCCNKLNYEIDVNGNSRKFHINMLKRYIHRNPDTQLLPASVAILDSDESEEGEVITVPSYVQQESWKEVKCNEELEQPMLEEVRTILEGYEDVFTDVPGKTHVTQCKIEVCSSEVIRIKPYPIPYNLHSAVKEELQSMKDLGIIEPSESPYSSPLCVSPKKGNKIRLCLDLRQLNKIVSYDAEPMCDPEAIFSTISPSRYFSKLDLTKGYWQIPLSEESKKYTAFSTPEGLFQFTVLPFGLVNAPAVFNRLMRNILGDLDNVETFLDDILIHTVTWEEHCKVLEEVFKRLRKANLTAKPSKCEIGEESLEYLGHIVGNGYMKPTSQKIVSIREAKRPTTKKEVRSFLGLSGYYRRYIPDYATIAVPLTNLTKKNAPNKVIWGPSQQEAFDRIKDSLTKEPILKLVDFNKPFILRTDASNTGLGAVLLQEHDGEKWPTAFASKKLSTAEQKYSVVERECLAIVWAMRKF